MKKSRFFAIAVAIMFVLALGLFGCGPKSDESVVTVTAKQAQIELQSDEVSGYDYTSLFTVTKDGAAVTVTASMIDSSAVKAEAGTYSVKCTYEEKSASISVTVLAKQGGTDPVDPKPDDPKPDDPKPGTDWGDWADVHNAKATIKPHAEGKVTYRFEAEFTDLRGKGYAPGYSGSASSPADMAVGIKGGGACVSYLYSAGLTVNFLVVSDRDVEDAELSLRLGAEFMVVPISPDVFTIRVDRKIDDELLYDFEDAEHDGALGVWDEFFLNTYTDPEETDFVMIDEFECPAGSKIDGSANRAPGSFQAFKITSHLSLKQGVNCISIIIEGKELGGQTDSGTMECIAPCIDCMDIFTDAQLGFFGQKINGYKGDGLSIVA